MVFNMSDLSRTIIIILIVFILGSIFITLLPYIILAGIAVWITTKIFKYFKKNNKEKEQIKVEVKDDTFDEMKKDAIDVDYEELNKK
jgi:hypothetical protein